ncbi:hypothetical protein LIER_11864 [Lithospermum erythrorhizon]|uniref:Uncharacterized protein n=1 Tax=Lithospermum erythrorhizon TaxID=34254 RepID=A0AAV3PPN2_LITER
MFSSRAMDQLSKTFSRLNALQAGLHNLGLAVDLRQLAQQTVIGLQRLVPAGTGVLPLILKSLPLYVKFLRRHCKSSSSLAFSLQLANPGGGPADLFIGGQEPPVGLKHYPFEVKELRKRNRYRERQARARDDIRAHITRRLRHGWQRKPDQQEAKTSLLVLVEGGRSGEVPPITLGSTVHGALRSQSSITRACHRWTSGGGTKPKTRSPGKDGGDKRINKGGKSREKKLPSRKRTLHFVLL